MTAELPGVAGSRVLVVEDEALIAEELRERLTQLGATVVAAVSSGAAALRAAEEHEQDLVLLDIRLKGAMDGIEVAEALRARADVPVVFLTAHADDATLGRAKRVNPAGYLVKPFDDTMLRVVLELAMYRHATGRRLAEQEAALRASRERLLQAQRLEAIGRISGGMAHDINNLMTIVTGFAELLLAKTKESETRCMLEKMKRAGDRSAHLTHQLLGFSQRLTLAPEPIELAAFVAALEPTLRALVGPQVVLILLLSPPPCAAFVDPAHLRTILLSLVDNANRAMPTGGTLTVESTEVDVEGGSNEATLDVTLPGRYARVSVRDTGIGMDEQTRAQLFEPFFKPRPFDRTTGVSLAAAYGILRQSGGHIRIDSAVDRGTVVELLLSQPRDP